MTIGPAPRCYECAHQHKDDPRSCLAFDVIPEEIFFQGVPHDKPFPGDHGVQFEPRVAATNDEQTPA